MQGTREQSLAGIGSVLAFLQCRTPPAWVERAVSDLDTLLLDHASLELKAAEQAQKLIRRYGSRSPARGGQPDAAFQSRLVTTMSRLAREELRHFEQVVQLIESRGGHYRAVSSSRYAAGLHELARKSEPGALVDALIVGAVIEARSCERFYSLVEQSDRLEQRIASFYTSLLRSESRHFRVYLELAESAAGDDIPERVDVFLQRDRELIESGDAMLRFHSGMPRRVGDERGRRLNR